MGQPGNTLQGTTENDKEKNTSPKKSLMANAQDTPRPGTGRLKK